MSHSPRRLVLVAVLALALLPAGAGTATGTRTAARAAGFVIVARGLTNAVYVTSAPGDPSTLYVVEQEGRIVTVRGGAAAGTFLDIRDRVLFDGERGLLSVAFHPDYATNHLFYVDYTDKHGDTHVVEFKSANGVADVASARELLFVQQPYPNHKGGQLEFDRNGLLYVGMGDGGTNPASGPTSIGDPENRAQSSASMLGKLLRIDPTQPGATWKVVGMGLRNPWRFSFDRVTGNLWIGDVGAARFEEVDFRPRAQIGTRANFGWSRYEGLSLYNRKVATPPKRSLVWPTWVYGHTAARCGVIGGYVYRGSAAPALRGRYVFGDLCAGAVWSFKVGPKGRASRVTSVGQTLGASLSSFGEDGKGELYAVSLDGFLFELR
jgi:glucose/arabinose dehydrogenase